MDDARYRDLFPGDNPLALSSNTVSCDRRRGIPPARAGTCRRLGMNGSGLVGLAALLAALSATAAQGQTPAERGGYLVNTIMTCNNCHTPMGPNGPQFDKALSGGLRFNEPPFDVTGSNLTPDPETGLGKWSDADLK